MQRPRVSFEIVIAPFLPTQQAFEEVLMARLITGLLDRLGSEIRTLLKEVVEPRVSDHSL
jgi:hypothetical protein